MLSYNHPKRAVNLIDEKNFKIIFESQTVFSLPKEKKYALSQLTILSFLVLFVCLFCL